MVAESCKNASNFVAANPDAEAQRLHDQIRTDKIYKKIYSIYNS